MVKVNANGITYELTRTSDGTRVKALHGQLKRFLTVPAYITENPYYFRLFDPVGVQDDNESFREPVSVHYLSSSDSETTLIRVVRVWCC